MGRDSGKEVLSRGIGRDEVRGWEVGLAGGKGVDGGHTRVSSAEVGGSKTVHSSLVGVGEAKRTRKGS